MPEISVIIPNWNGKNLLADCLGALRRQTYQDFETILVDNGSTDGSREFVGTQFPQTTLLALPENLGFAGGTLAGYAHAKGQIIVLLNNDTEAHPQWLEEIHKASQSFPEVGSFASKMMFFDERDRIENCGFEMGIAGETVDLGRGEHDVGQWSEFRKVFGGCGGAVAYRRQMLEDIGFLDPDFVMIYEDVDLSFRAQLRGYDCVYVPRAIVYHRYRITIGKAPERQVFFSQRNIDFVWVKNMPLGLMLRSLPFRMLYEFGAAIYFTRKGDGAAFLKSKLAVLQRLPSLLRKRRQIQRGRTASNAQIRCKLRFSIFAAKWRKLLAVWAER